jgi:hypothetical protein
MLSEAKHLCSFLGSAGCDELQRCFASRSMTALISGDRQLADES